MFSYLEDDDDPRGYQKERNLLQNATFHGERILLLVFREFSLRRTAFGKRSESLVTKLLSESRPPSLLFSTQQNSRKESVKWPMYVVYFVEIYSPDCFSEPWLPRLPLLRLLRSKRTAHLT